MISQRTVFGAGLLVIVVVLGVGIFVGTLIAGTDATSDEVPQIGSGSVAGPVRSMGPNDRQGPSAGNDEDSPTTDPAMDESTVETLNDSDEAGEQSASSGAEAGQNDDGDSGAETGGSGQEGDIGGEDTGGEDVEEDQEGDSDDVAGPPVIEIVGPARVECYGRNHLYEVANRGGEIISWNWRTQVGLQTLWYEGPTAILSFDLRPGVYGIAVTVNGTVTATKDITVDAAPGCIDGTPSPQIVGPRTVPCGSEREFSVGNKSATAITEATWRSGEISISDESSTGASLRFPASAGSYEISLEVDGGVVTTRRVQVEC